MADRKKVPKIRARRVGNSTAKKNAKATKEFHKTKTESIRMNSQNNKTIYEPVTQKRNSDNGAASVNRNKPKTVYNSQRGQAVKRNNNSFSVIRGKKSEFQRKKLVMLCVSLIAIVSVLIFCLTSPTGPIERITNSFELIGSGDFSNTLNGAKILSLQKTNNKVFALTNSHLCGFSFSGKDFLQLQHNFSNPVLELSEERSLIYNRESNKFIIANNSGAIFEESLQQPIFCGDISYNGSVAFACEASSYSAQILVFDKNMKQYYKWYLADGLVSDIAVSDNGKFVAVAVLKVKNGEFVSQLYCINTKEQEPIFTKEFVGETILKVESTSSSEFVYTSDKKISFVKWKTGEEINKNNFGATSYFEVVSEYYLAIFGETNHSEIVLFEDDGEVHYQFEFNGIIDDISIYDDQIYILSSNKVFCFNSPNKDKTVLNLDNNVDYVLGVNNGFVSFNNINMEFVPIDANQ